MSLKRAREESDPRATQTQQPEPDIFEPPFQRRALMAPIRRMSYRRPAPFARRRRSASRRFAYAPALAGIPTNPAGFVTRWNPRPRQQIIKTIRTDYDASDINGAAGAVAQNYCFDPSNTITASGTFVKLGVMPDWSSYAALFQQYHVEKLVLNFYYKTSQTTDGAIFPEMFVNNVYNIDQAAPSVNGLENISGWDRVLFTNEHRNYKRVIYPKLDLPTTTGSATYGQSVRGQGWLDCSLPSELLGMMLYIPYLETGDNIRVDVEFHMKFKSQI